MQSLLSIENSELIFNKKKIYFILDEKNQPWFKAKDLAETLEYQDTKRAIQRHVDKEDKLFHEKMIKHKGDVSPPFKNHHRLMNSQ